MRGEPHAPIKQESRDIVCAPESHVDSDHATSETFPTIHSYFRNDGIELGGEVFIGVRKDFAWQSDSMIADSDSILVDIDI